jgi:hypothetical protein
MTSTSRRARLIAAAIATGVSASAWALPASAAPTAHSATLHATGAIGTVVTGEGQVAVDGDTAVDVSVADDEGGQVRVVDGPSSSLPRAWQFPTYQADGAYPRAAVGLSPTDGDAFSPGGSDFSYGSVFRLDAASSGRSSDNGDNIFQRGRYSEPAMFKLQVDHGYPSCMVKGSTGRASVKSSVKVDPDAWYAATCSRVGSTLTIAVTAYGGDTVTDRADGDAGSVTFPDSLPASIGGKLNSSSLALANGSDQLNGAVAQVSISRL